MDKNVTLISYTQYVRNNEAEAQCKVARFRYVSLIFVSAIADIINRLGTHSHKARYCSLIELHNNSCFSDPFTGS